MDSILCEIWEYDLNTSALRFVLSTGTVETSFPRGIDIYPYENNGSVYSVHCVSILVVSVSILCTLFFCVWLCGVAWISIQSLSTSHVSEQVWL